MWKFLEPIWIVCDCVGTVLGVCFIIYAINCVLMCMRPEMAMEIDFKKLNMTHPHPLPTAGVPATPQKSLAVTSND